MSNACEVCCENFNKTKNKKNKCQNCDYSVCSKCNEQYILSLNTKAKCMSCNVYINYETMISYFNKKFYNTVYKSHIDEQIVKADKLRLPEDQRTAEILIYKRKLDDRLKVLLAEVKTHYPLIVKCDTENYYPEEFLKTQIRLSSIEREVAFIKTDMKTIKEREEREKIKYIKKCSKNGCIGFINEDHVCGLCESEFCKKCNEVMENAETHVCDQATADTVQLLNKDTKNCPNIECNIPITKIDGCDQMFCTKCKVVFSWKTGETVKKGEKIHNPHYYQYMRDMNNGVIPREENDDPCTIPEIDLFISKMKKLKVTKEELFTVTTIHRIYNHIDGLIIPRWLQSIESYEIRAKTNRILYLTRRKDDIEYEQLEDNYKATIIMLERDKETATDIIELYQTYQNVIKDKLRDMVLVTNIKKFREIYNTMDYIKQYFNEIINKLANKYNKSLNLIADTKDDTNWTLTTTGLENKKRKRENSNSD